MEKRVGSGRIVVAPIITEDGQPIMDPSSNGANSGEEVKSNEIDSSISENRNDSINLDKEVIQWKLTLHQIGENSYLQSPYNILVNQVEIFF